MLFIVRLGRVFVILSDDVFIYLPQFFIFLLYFNLILVNFFVFWVRRILRRGPVSLKI